jgi:hypothetical protein
MTSLLRTIRTISLAGGAALLLSVPSIAGKAEHDASSRAAVAFGGCTPNAVKFKVSTLFQSTTSTSPVDVSETTLNFGQGGTSASCAIVSFSSEASAAANEVMLVDAVLDGSTICSPGGNFFVRSNSVATDLADRAMNYVCPDVAPGKHSVKIQFRSGGGGQVALDFRTTLAHFTSVK